MRKFNLIKIVSVIFALSLLTMFTAPHTNNTYQAENVTLAQSDDYPPPPIVPNADYYLGAYYMSQPLELTGNWHSLILYNRESGNYRKPLQGYAPGDSLLSMDMDIKWAVESGLSYFIFNDFWSYSQTEPLYPQSINAFMNAEYSDYMQFAVMISKIAAPEDENTNFVGEKFLTDVADRYRDVYFKQPNYLHIDGKPVVYIYASPHSLGIGHHRYNDIAFLLRQFEAKVGQQVYWVYSIPIADQRFFSFYKQMGMDMVAPYYVAADVTVNADPNVILDHRDFVEQSYAADKQMRTFSIASGLKFVSSPTLNFDARNTYLSLWWFLADRTRHTTNPDIANYEWLLTQMKADLDALTSASIAYIDGKIMLNLGAWNEFGEGSALAPGYGELNPDDPFALANLVRDIFTTPSGDTYPENYYPPHDLTPEVPTQSEWDMSDPANLVYFNNLPTSTNLYEILGASYAEVAVDQTSFLMLELAANVEVADYNTVRIEFGAQCGEDNQVANCIKRLEIATFTTNCTGDTPESCEDLDTPNHYGFEGLRIADCEAIDEALRVRCDFYMADVEAWQDRLEMMNILFYLTDFGAAHKPVTIQLESIELLNTEGVTQTGTQTGISEDAIPQD